MTRPAAGSAHHQPRTEFRPKPTSTATANAPSIRVTRASVMSTWLPSERPVLSLPAASANMTTAVTATHAVPSGLGRG